MRNRNGKPDKGQIIAWAEGLKADHPAVWNRITERIDDDRVDSPGLETASQGLCFNTRKFRLRRWVVYANVAIVLVITVALIAMFQPIRHLPRETVEPSLSDASLYGSDQLEPGIHFFKNVYAWDDFSDAKIHHLELKIESESGLAPWIQAIDDDLNAFVTFGGAVIGSKGAYNTDGSWVGDRIDSFPLYEYDLKTGERNELFTPSPYCYAKVIAVRDDLLVWTEVGAATYDESNDKTTHYIIERTMTMHLFLRATGEDIEISTPEWDKSIHSTNHINEPYLRMVFAGDAIYFSAMDPGTNTVMPECALYRYDLSSRTLAEIGKNLYNPVLYRDQVAWRSWYIGKSGDASEIELVAARSSDNEFESVFHQIADDIGIFKDPYTFGSNFGIAGSVPYLIDSGNVANSHAYGIRRIAGGSSDPILMGNDNRVIHASIIDDYVGINIFSDYFDAFRVHVQKYLYVPEKDALVRLDGIPSDLNPMLSGTDIMGVDASNSGCKVTLSDTTKMMYLTPDGPGDNDGTYTLYWFDLADLR